MQAKPLRVRTGARVAALTAGLALVVAAGGCASKQEREARREAKRLRHVQMDPSVAKGLTPHPSPVAGLTPASPVMTATPRFAPVDASDSAAATMPTSAVYAAALPAYEGSRFGAPPAPLTPPTSPNIQPAYLQQQASPTGGAVQYTVMQGDTLFGIARARYGSGGQWQRIASANPGLSPETLKAGTTILVP